MNDCEIIIIYTHILCHVYICVCDSDWYQDSEWECADETTFIYYRWPNYI